MEEEKDFYMENGFVVFTAAHHLKRGKCCQNKCRHCPWDYGKPKQFKDQKQKTQKPES